MQQPIKQKLHEVIKQECLLQAFFRKVYKKHMYLTLVAECQCVDFIISK